jgi:hypothetical protein
MVRALAVLLVLVAGEARADDADLEALGKAAPPCDAARAHCLGIKLHVAVEGAGPPGAGTDGAVGARPRVPVASADWVARQVAHANRHFASIGVAFQVDSVAALPEEAARIEDAQERTSLAKLVAGTVIDVFVTAQLDDIDKQDGVIYGVAWPAGGKKLVILSTMGWERTLAHELGHVFGLPHSRYAISIMNKRGRKQPPLEQRTFHPAELAVMRARLAAMLRERVIAHVPPRREPVNGPISAPFKARP